MIRKINDLLFLTTFFACSIIAASALITPELNSRPSITRSRSRTKPTQRRDRGFKSQYIPFDARLRDTQLYNKLLDFLSPFESKIPEELREEIYQAEANTAAAKDRGTRVAIYTSLAIFGIALASFNGFLTDMRDKESAIAIATAATSIPDTGNNLYILEQNGFGWVLSNPILKFFFTNKIGGVLSLLFGGGSGIMAEAEFDSKRINAEKIYEELQRRREQKLKKQAGGSVRTTSKKKRRSGKEKKRLAAISEVMMNDVPDASTKAGGESGPSTGIPVMPPVDTSDSLNDEESPSLQILNDDEKSGIFGKVKEFYEKADAMAASQALIMNKNLEEAGLVEKITDETGLKVIGREQAKNLEVKKSIEEEK
mmetsp:Transcript_4149/g.10764  ORF Transcript_4149/g.10764 Transcript_4149/m.10764 type:complete len:369 (+) Transcript_4149:212-1318(+)